MLKLLSFMSWLLAAFFCGIVTTTIASVLICGLVSQHVRIRYPQPFTFSRLHSIRDDAKTFKVKNDRYPNSFDEFINKDPNQRHYRTNDAGRPVDDWNNELVYVRRSDSPEILSYGSDGKEGGMGFDRDLSSDHKYLPSALGTELLLFPFARGIIFSCIIAGCVVSIISLLMMRPRQFSSLDSLPWERMTNLALLSVGSAIAIILFMLMTH
ncbi:type II secretion system protein GspG [bacterium]|nr:type II secretion system protein GspG [bacterium]